MLEHFFGSKTRVKLMKTFFRHPEQPFYVRELARLIETQLNAVRREIAHLELAGLLVPVPQADVPNRDLGTDRSKYYKLNTKAMLYSELKALLMKAEVMEEQALVNEVKEKAGDVALLLLTGHFTQEPDVDTDMLIVGTLKPTIIAKIIQAYEDDMGKAVRYTLMDEREFRDRREIGDRFLYSIFEAKHIMVVNRFESVH
jgi:hypothetical protein